VNAFKMTLGRNDVVSEDDVRIETCRSDFKSFNVKFSVSAFVG